MAMTKSSRIQTVELWVGHGYGMQTARDTGFDTRNLASKVERNWNRTYNFVSYRFDWHFYSCCFLADWRR